MAERTVSKVKTFTVFPLGRGTRYALAVDDNGKRTSKDVRDGRDARIWLVLRGLSSSEAEELVSEAEGERR